MRILQLTALLSMLGGFGIPQSFAQQPENSAEQIAALKLEMNNAIQQVQKIVNQPVRSLARTPEMNVAEFQPGWFHPGAIKPKFNTVDVRSTQELTYDKYDYVTSNVTPGVVFVGKELEFNSMTKYFYTDRSLPKKKLSQPEMSEINRLYRIIGRCEQQLAALTKPEPASNSGANAEQPAPRTENGFVKQHYFYMEAGLLLAAFGLYFRFKRRVV